MSECIFCKIIKGEIPCYKVYEDDIVIAFLDINPLSKGHTLVVPKFHVSRISEMSEEQVKKYFESLQKVIKLIEEKISNDYNIIVNQGKNANQEIEHLHVHIVPRYGSEKIFLWESHKLTEEEAKEILDKIKE